MYTRFFRTFTAVVLSLSLVMSMCVVTSFGASSPPKIEKVSYEGGGKVDVDFYGKVNYKSPKVTVKDSSGKKYSATIVERDDDDLDFKVKNYKKGKKYKFSISGIKRAGTSGYTKVKGTFKIKSSVPLKVKEVDYDDEDRELCIEFNKKVQWKNAKVTVTNSSGKKYTTKIIEKDSDDIEVYVDGLTYGKKYNYKVSGVKAKTAKNYTTLKGTFKAIDR